MFLSLDNLKKLQIVEFRLLDLEHERILAIWWNTGTQTSLVNVL